MNKAKGFESWRRGGNHYVLKATSDNKWVGFQETVINALQSKFKDDFLSGNLDRREQGKRLL